MHDFIFFSYNNLFIPCGWRWLTWDFSSTLALIFETYGTFWTSLWSAERWLPSPARKSSFTSWWYSLWTFQAWMPKHVVCPCILPQHLIQCLFADFVRVATCVQCRILSHGCSLKKSLNYNCALLFIFKQTYDHANTFRQNLTTHYRRHTCIFISVITTTLCRSDPISYFQIPARTRRACSSTKDQ